MAFCERLVREHGVAAIPVSAFYAEDAIKSVVRFCFAKTRRSPSTGRWRGWRRWRAKPLDLTGGTILASCRLCASSRVPPFRPPEFGMFSALSAA